MAPKTIKNVLFLGAASASNVAMTALQSLILGRLLDVDMFGVTRTATAYMIFLSMLGHFTLHNALASRIVNAQKNGDITSYIMHATAMVAGISTLIAAIASLIIAGSGFWTDQLKLPLIVIISSLPIVCLTILLNACLEALGAYTTYMRVIFLTGFVPLAIITPLAWLYELPGWLAGKILASLLLVLIAVFAIRDHFKPCPINRHHFKELFLFARIQIFSGLLSLTLLSADVILLEALTHDLKAVANYGVALLFYNACAIVPTTLGRVYFRQIAPAAADARKKQIEFMLVTCGLGIISALALNYLGPPVIGLFFDANYELAKQVLQVMSFGLTFNYLWLSLSTINIATNHPQTAVAISAVGAVVGMTALLMLIPEHRAIGTAWAMVLAYGSGAALGLWQLCKRISPRGTPHAG